MNRGNMAVMTSPDDPLFFLHHANVDRMWAIWQDYWNQTGVDPYDDQEFTTPEFYRSSEPVGDPVKNQVFDVDQNMVFQLVTDKVDTESMPFFNKPNGETPTLRDMLRRYVELITSQTSIQY
jgi:hypothetical protein